MFSSSCNEVVRKQRESHKKKYILYQYRWWVLFAYFMASATTGVIIASLSTNRPIILNAYKDLTSAILQTARYADLVLYLPCMFMSTYVIDNYGLRSCVMTGSGLMFVGSFIRVGATYTGTFWPVFFGHIVS